MPPLVFETVAWLRYYVSLPFPLLPGEAEANVSADPARHAFTVPLAGALIGAVGALALVVAYVLHLSAFASAAFALIVLALVTGAVTEKSVIVSGDQLGAGSMRDGNPGLVILIAVVLLRMGVVFALVQVGILQAAIALIAAGAISRGAAVAFAMSSAAPGDGGVAGSSEMQKLAVAAIAIAVALILPTYGLGSAIAGLAAGIGAAAVVNAFAPKTPGIGRELSGPPEIAAEIAFLSAVYIFISA